MSKARPSFGSQDRQERLATPPVYPPRRGGDARLLPPFVPLRGYGGGADSPPPEGGGGETPKGAGPPGGGRSPPPLGGGGPAPPPPEGGGGRRERSCPGLPWSSGLEW